MLPLHFSYKKFAKTLLFNIIHYNELEQRNFNAEIMIKKIEFYQYKKSNPNLCKELKRLNIKGMHCKTDLHLQYEMLHLHQNYTYLAWCDLSISYSAIHINYHLDFF